MLLTPEDGVDLSLSVEQFVNADLIAQGLSPFAPATSALQAGRIMLHRIHEFRDRQEDFAFETTLATRSYTRFLRDAREAGYRRIPTRASASYNR